MQQPPTTAGGCWCLLCLVVGGFRVAGVELHAAHLAGETALNEGGVCFTLMLCHVVYAVTAAASCAPTTSATLPRFNVAVPVVLSVSVPYATSDGFGTRSVPVKLPP